MSYLLDTDTISAHLKQDSAVAGFMLQYMGRISVSAISVGELMTWALRRAAPAKRLIGVRQLLGDLDILPMTPEIAEEYGRLRAALLDAGHPTPEMDLWIAATAVHHDLVLVTHNARHFVHVPGLAVEDWLTR